MNLYETVKRWALPVVLASSLATVGCKTAVLSHVEENECSRVKYIPVQVIQQAPAPETTYVKHSGTVKVDVDVHEHGYHHHGKANLPGDASGH